MSAPIFISLTSPEVVSVFCGLGFKGSFTGLALFKMLCGGGLARPIGASCNQRELTEDCNRNHRKIRITAPLVHSDLELAVMAMPAIDRRARDNGKSYHTMWRKDLVD
jgi:hypothetical protein